MTRRAPARPVFAVTVEAAPPPDAVPLSPPVAEAAAAALAEVLGGAHSAVRADGGRLQVHDHFVGTHPHGAVTAIIVSAPAASDATEAVRALVAHVLATRPVLAGWVITAAEAEEVPVAASRSKTARSLRSARR